MDFRRLPLIALAALVLGACSEQTAEEDDPTDDLATPAEVPAEPPGKPGLLPSGELMAPDGFAVAIFHEGVGNGARHLVVRGNGDVLVARRDGTLVALRDSNGDGQADQREERELPITTGVALHDGYLYFSDTVSVSRLPLDEALLPEGQPEVVVSGFPEQSSHAAKTLAFDADGRLYVNVGAPSNACQEQSRSAGSPGQQPCPQLERQAAVWRFAAGAVGLEQGDGERFITGVRNVIAMDWNASAGALYFAMHGRDQLNSLWPELFDADDNARLPAEELHRASAGADYGWPYTYFDPLTNRRVVAPEYGGDGEEEAEAGRYPEPLHAFPAHWAPNDLLFYDGGQFPPRYAGGAFIAWHGSWNRAPQPQEGYRVTFVPFADGTLSAAPADFLAGFAGTDEIAQPGDAEYRPMGLGVGPDGALYVGDTQQGRIWRVTYTGSAG